MFEEQVVIHFLDGRVLNGYGDNFFPGEDRIMVLKALSEEVVTVKLAEVKVVCFVRTLAPQQKERNREPQALLYQAVPGRHVDILFKDGEHLEGVASISDKPARGFFVTPLNPQSNNVQIYVNPDAMARFRFVG